MCLQNFRRGEFSLICNYALYYRHLVSNSVNSCLVQNSHIAAYAASLGQLTRAYNHHSAGQNHFLYLTLSLTPSPNGSSPTIVGAFSSLEVVTTAVKTQRQGTVNRRILNELNSFSNLFETNNCWDLCDLHRAFS